MMLSVQFESNRDEVRSRVNLAEIFHMKVLPSVGDKILIGSYTAKVMEITHCLNHDMPDVKIYLTSI